MLSIGRGQGEARHRVQAPARPDAAKRSLTPATRQPQQHGYRPSAATKDETTKPAVCQSPTTVFAAAITAA